MAAAAHVVLANVGDEPTDYFCELAAFIHENEQYIEEDNCPQFDSWICELLDMDDSTPGKASPFPATFVKESIPNLQSTIKSFDVHKLFKIHDNMLLDTGAQERICTSSLLQNANWRPIKIF